METSLHKSLKLIHADGPDNVEIQLGTFRIDAVDDQERLVEIQLAGLGAIQQKAKILRDDYPLRIIKPIVRRKVIETTDSLGKEIVRTRKSPKHGRARDVFADLIHFTKAFPHPNLELEVLLVDARERRQPRKRRGWRKKQYRVLDQFLDDVGERYVLSTARDLWRILELPARCQRQFDTKWLSEQIEAPRWFAQQVAYVLERCETVSFVGKKGNTKQYRLNTISGNSIKRAA